MRLWSTDSVSLMILLPFSTVKSRLGELNAVCHLKSFSHTDSHTGPD